MKRFVTVQLAIMLFCAGVPLVLGAARPADAQSFVATGSMSVARGGFTGTRLSNGQVLIVGGRNGTAVLSSAELYNSVTGTFSLTGSMSTPRYSHAATLLQDGTVLVTGGAGAITKNAAALSSAEIYNPTTGIFSPVGNMTQPRVYQTATLLRNGNILVAGGAPGANAFNTGGVATAEIYNPSTKTFSATGSLTNARYSQTATLLGNNRVLIAGGLSTSITASGVLASAELYNSTTGKFTTTGAMNAARVYDTATLLATGEVLFAGGATNGSVMLSSAEFYNSSTGAFTPTGSMAAVRGGFGATRLQNGEVLVAGGAQVVPGSNILSSAELYDPSSGTFSATASMSAPRTFFAATLLGNGDVLVAGGGSVTGYLASAELYVP